MNRGQVRVSIRGVKSLGSHFPCLCRGVWFLWSKKNKNKSCIFQKENGNNLTLLIIILVKTIQKEQIAQITQYDPWSAGLNLRSTQSDLTPWILTLGFVEDGYEMMKNYLNNNRREFGNLSDNAPKHYRLPG